MPNSQIERLLALHGFKREVDKAGDCYERASDAGWVVLTRTEVDGLEAPTEYEQPVTALITDRATGLEVAFDLGPLQTLFDAGERGGFDTIALVARLAEALAYVQTPDGEWIEGPASRPDPKEKKR